MATLLDRFDTDDWERPSPCEQWDVGAVVRHLVVGERAFTQSLGGRAYDLAGLTEQVREVPSVDLPVGVRRGRGAAALCPDRGRPGRDLPDRSGADAGARGRAAADH